MNEFIKEFIQTYGVTIMYAVLTALAGIIGSAIKRLYQKYVTDKTKSDVVRTCVRAAEQLYKDLHGEEKYSKAVEAATQILLDKGIQISDLEIKMLIEAAVSEFNNAFGQCEYEEPTTSTNAIGLFTGPSCELEDYDDEEMLAEEDNED